MNTCVHNPQPLPYPVFFLMYPPFFFFCTIFRIRSWIASSRRDIRSICAEPWTRSSSIPPIAKNWTNLAWCTTTISSPLGPCYSSCTSWVNSNSFPTKRLSIRAPSTWPYRSVACWGSWYRSRPYGSYRRPRPPSSRSSEVSTRFRSPSVRQ